jgi:hypothetical protein
MYDPNKFTNTVYVPTTSNPNRSLAHAASVDAPLNLQGGPRRVLRSKQGSRLAPASVHVTSGTLLTSLDPARIPAVADGIAIDNTRLHPSSAPPADLSKSNNISALDFMTAAEDQLHASAAPFNLAAEEAHPVVAANIVTPRMRMAVDPHDRGFGPINSGADRVAYKNEAYMNRLHRVRERTEVDPYTGRKIDYYRTVAPEGNTDRRITQDQLKHQNPLLRLRQGYDSTRPRPRRREVQQALPEAQNVFGDAPYQERIRGEMVERVGRQIMLNHNGESVATVKDSGQPFGFNGYQNMLRFIPYVPPTMRADTESLTPAVDQMMNPNPQREAAVVRGRQTRYNTKRVEQVEWRGPVQGLPGAPVRGEMHALKAHRTEYSTQGPTQGPGGLTGSSGGQTGNLVVGAQRPVNRKLPDRIDPELRGAVAALAGSGAGEVATTAVLRAHMDRRLETKRMDTVGPMLSGLTAFAPAEINSQNRIDSVDSRKGHRLEGQNFHGYEQTLNPGADAHVQVPATRVARGTKRHDTLGVISVPELVQIMMPHYKPDRVDQVHDLQDTRRDGQRDAVHTGHATAHFGESQEHIETVHDGQDKKLAEVKGAAVDGRGTWQTPADRASKHTYEYNHVTKRHDQPGAARSGYSGADLGKINTTSKMTTARDRRQNAKKQTVGAIQSGHSVRDDPERMASQVPSAHAQQKLKKQTMRSQTARGPMPEKDVTIDAQAFRSGKHNHVMPKSDTMTKELGAIVNKLGREDRGTTDRMAETRDHVTPKREGNDKQSRQFKAPVTNTITAPGRRPEQTRKLAKRGTADQARALNFGHGGVVNGTGGNAVVRL